jgi:hypothetical protein
MTTTFAMSFDPSPGRIVLVFVLLTAAATFGYCLRAITSRAALPPTSPVVGRPSSPYPYQPPLAGYAGPAAPPIQEIATPAQSQSPDADNRDRQKVLVEALVDAYDTFDSERVRAYVSQSLADAGIVRIEVPNGTRFDASLHRADGNVPAPSPQQGMLVADNRRPGWRYQHGPVIRRPDVTVFVWQETE